MISLRWSAVTDTGRVRPHNEDEVLADGDVLLFAVADGMGGHAAGEVASEVAVQALKTTFAANRTHDGLVEAVREANQAVWRRAHESPDTRGMGTTLTAAALVEVDGEERLVIAHVGDSRAYLLRDGDFEQVTDDHSLVEELVRSGRLRPEDADDHPQKNIVTRVIGMEDRDGNPADIEVDVVEIAPFRGDRLLLASDGLSNELTDAQIATVLRRLADANDAASELVRQARAAGGNDNISVVLVDVVDDDDKAGAASAALADEPLPPTRATAAVTAPASDRRAADTAAAGATADGAAPRRAKRRDRRQRLTFRTVGFVAALLILLALAVAAITWYARGSYFVGTRGDQVMIFHGRPGGFLWVDPTVEEPTGIKVSELPPAQQDQVRGGQAEPTLGAARHFVSNLKDEAAARRQQLEATTTSSTSTTAPPTATTAAR